MKFKHSIIVLAAAAGFSGVAHGQVQLTVTGSTAFRSIALDRLPTLFDAGSLQSNTSDTGKQKYFFTGTMSNLIPSFGSSPVTIRSSFSGSGSGMTSVKNGTLLPCINLDGGATNLAAEISFSDVYPASAAPSIPASAFSQRVEVGVVGFLFFKNNNLSGITNITREQAILAMTASGDGGMPASFLGGTGGGAVNPIYMIGRDSGSGSRITVEKDLGFVGSPNLWQTNGDGTYSLGTGYDSGGKVANATAGGSQSIGYFGLADYVAVSSAVTPLSYEGIPYSHANVAVGMYPMWGYEHLVSKIGISANQITLRDKLVFAITNATYQASAVYSNSFVSLSDMHVKRGSDGGTITSKDF